MLSRQIDLIVISAIAVTSASLAITGLHFGAWLSILGILMVLVLPGYLYSQLLLPELPLEELMLVSLGLSIVIVGLSGLLMNLTPWGLSPLTWGIWLALVTLTGVLVLWRKRQAQGKGSRFTLTWPTISWPSVLPYGIALAFMLLSLGLFRASSIQINTPLTSLWANYDQSRPNILNVGVRNQEKSSQTYNIVVQQNGVRVYEWPAITLEPETTFSGQYTFPQRPQQAATILLYRADAPGQPYRQVKIDFTVQIEQIRRK